ncbi:hypothetical protein ABVT39_010018 [Epinephelus coioides]
MQRVVGHGKRGGTTTTTNGSPPLTDNGSYFVKAFKTYAPSPSEPDQEEQAATPPERDEEENEEQDVVFTDVGELLGTTGQFSLPPHFRLDIRALTEREQLFLKEYCSVLKPLTIALDILQGDSYYGALLPTLETLMSRTLALQHGLSRMTADLPGVIVQAIKTRFTPVLESREALLAALTLPKFKAQWIGGAERKEEARALLIAECHTHTLPHAGAAEQAEKNNNEKEEDAMSFSADSEGQKQMKHHLQSPDAKCRILLQLERHWRGLHLLFRPSQHY